MFKFTFKDDFPELLGETREIRKVFFENICVKDVDDDLWFEEKIGQIVSFKERNLSTKSLEDEIDLKIYSLYELTPSERMLISGEAATIAASEDSISLISASVNE